jgi:hypothetical protein
MTVTSDPPIGSACAPDPVALEVRVLDADAVLSEVIAERRAAEVAEARVLMLAVHYVDLHPVTEESPAASPAVGERLVIDRDPAPAGTPEAIAAESLAGEGTPGVAEYAVEELGAVLGVPYSAAYRLCAEAVAVCYRLPRLWARVHAGQVPAWQARMVARETRGLSVDAVGFVDGQVAILADRRRLPSLPRLRDLVHEARCRMDPDHERAVEETALGDRGVWFDHQTSTASAATSTLTAVLDAWDALDLDSAVTDVAKGLRALGDTRGVDVRRADALVLLAHPQRVLDLGHTAAAHGPDQDVDTGTDAGSGTGAEVQAQATGLQPFGPGGRVERTPGSAIHLYVHVGLADLAQAGVVSAEAGSGSVSVGGCASVERLGPMLLDGLQCWLGRTERIIVRPILDPTDPDSPATRPVDRHDPPPAMRELVVLRDGQCVFPGCRVDARACDLDHIVAYADPDDGGPPGQTRPENLACLCRRHHRLKTFTGWHYERADDGSYRWTSPRGQHFTTHPLPKRAPAN